jgi:transposase
VWPTSKNKHLTYGECVKSMILNGLGFVGRTLYLYSEYFEDKPTDLLIGPSVKHQHIDDNVLGRTLDRLFQVGVTDLYTKIAISVVKHLGIQVSSLHLDSTRLDFSLNLNTLRKQKTK